MKNKKILTAVLVGSLIGVGLVGFAGCGKAHIHEYGQTQYIVENDKAFTYRKCGCGEETEKTELEEGKYVIVNPTTAQYILDGYTSVEASNKKLTELLDNDKFEINNKIVIFDKGEYNDELNIRPTAGSVDEIYGNLKNNVVGEKITDYSTLDDSKVYHYNRILKNVTFAGTEGANFNNAFNLCAQFHNCEDSGKILCTYDYVRKLDFSGVGKYKFFNDVNSDNIKFENLNFKTANGRLYLRNMPMQIEVQSVMTKNITVSGCTFINDSETKSSYNAIDMVTGTNSHIENVTIKNNKISGYNRAIDLVLVKNQYITDNEIENCAHNGVGIYRYSEEPNLEAGDVVVKNNTFKNGESRAIKVYRAKDANIVIENNKIENYCEEKDGDKQIFEVSDCKGETYLTANNNTYGGKNMTNFDKTAYSEIENIGGGMYFVQDANGNFLTKTKQA